MLGMGRNLEIEKYSSKIAQLESKHISPLNFGLYAVPLKDDIDAAEQESMDLFEKLNFWNCSKFLIRRDFWEERVDWKSEDGLIL